MKHIYKKSFWFLVAFIFALALIGLLFPKKASTDYYLASATSTIATSTVDTTATTTPVVAFSRSTKAKVTAYSGVESCHYPGCPMASGKKAYVGAVACPRALKLGTKVVIDGVNYTCEDRTAKRYDGRYDIFYGYSKADQARALKFGIKTLEIQVLK